MLMAAEAAVNSCKEKVAAVEAKGILATHNDKKLLQRAAGKLPALEQRLAAAQVELHHRIDKSEAEAIAAAAKQEAAAEREEVNRAFSEAGVMLMVEARLKLQHRIDNSSDKTDQVWKRVVYAVSQSVAKGDLPTSDLRSEKATEIKYKKEYGEFKLWCARAQRAVSYSGVPAEDVEEKVQEHHRPTTPLFLKFNMGMCEQLAMVLPN
eukprot:7072553-Prymnesium_polylepis.1